uniref:UDP-glucuronosyltransferase n=1 Tax=Panagrellus redivivus TaxID=6233 RepID=A0A7E4ZW94_PANRE
MKSIYLAAILVALAVNVHSAKILFTYGHDERSHIFSMMPLMKRLIAANHSIVVLETGKPQKPLNLGPKVEVLYCGLPSEVTSMESLFDEVLWHKSPTSFAVAMMHHIQDAEIRRTVHECSDVYNKILNSGIELSVVDEIFTLHGMLITQMLHRRAKIPYVVFGTSHVSVEWTLQTLAMFQNPILEPLHGTLLPVSNDDHFKTNRFIHRLRNFLDSFIEAQAHEWIWTHLVSPVEFGLHNFNAKDVIKHGAMHYREMLDRSRITTISQDFRPTGAHCGHASTELEGEFKDFVEDPTSKGTIYIAFGSLVSFTNCPDSFFNAFFDAMNELTDYRFIFALKAANRTLPQIGSHIKIVKWSPQHAILNHPKTKLFVTHGGLKSFKEAICTATPVITVPLFAEQVVSAVIGIRSGFGRVVNKYTVTKESFLAELNEILTKPSYQAAATKNRAIYLDRIIDHMDEANFFIDKILKSTREDNVVTFRRQGINHGWISYLNFDWLGVVLGSVLLIASFE